MLTIKYTWHCVEHDRKCEQVICIRRRTENKKCTGFLDVPPRSLSSGSAPAFTKHRACCCSCSFQIIRYIHFLFWMIKKEKIYFAQIFARSLKKEKKCKLFYSKKPCGHVERHNSYVETQTYSFRKLHQFPLSELSASLSFLFYLIPLRRFRDYTSGPDFQFARGAPHDSDQSR